mgnify:CR=1 FL=1
MYKIYLPSHWDISREDLLLLYNNLTPNESGIWRNIQLTNNLDESNFVLILDSCNEQIPLNKPVIFLGREPAEVHFYDYKKSNLYLFITSVERHGYLKHGG